MRFLYLLVFWLVCGLPDRCLGQDPLGVKQLRTVTVPPGPNAASLGKFGAVPLNQYTGLPQVNVPLYTVECGPLRVPVALAYHASLKVDDAPSWVGLSWSLSAGGVITRTVKGRADQSGQGYWGQLPAIMDSSGTALPVPYQSLVSNNVVDTQPDVFYYNVGSSSGALIFTAPDHAVASTAKGVDVYLHNNRIELLDKDGTLYVFGSGVNSRDETYTDTDHFTSAYHLDMAISASRRDTVFFSYQAETHTDAGTESEVGYYPASTLESPPPIAPQVTRAERTVTQQRLQSIRWRKGAVVFRSHVAVNGDVAQLDTVQVKDLAGTVRKQFVFYYGYLYSNTVTGPSQPQPGLTYTPDMVRRKLCALQEGVGATKAPKYVFKYYEHKSLPPRNSAQQDHWGYANLNTSYSLLPRRFYYLGGYVGGGDGDREPDFSSALAGVLKEITYPTGGKTQFVYETNRVSKFARAPAVVPVPATYALRVTKRNFDSNGAIDTTLTFTLSKWASGRLTYGAGITNMPTNSDGILTVEVRRGGGLLASCSTQPTSSSPFRGTVNCGGTAPMTSFPPGTYSMRIHGWFENGINAINTMASITFSLTEVQESSQALVGGIRIKRIVDVSNVAPGDSVVRAYSYDYPGAGGAVSSGVLVNMPAYRGGYTVISVDPRSPGCMGCEIPKSDSYTTVSSTPLGGLGTTQGSHVGYKCVTETVLQGSTPTGKKVSYFTAADDYGDQPGTPAVPINPITSNDFRRGQLIKQEIFSGSGQLLQRTRNRYKLDLRGRSQLKGLVVTPGRSVSPEFADRYPEYRIAYYWWSTRWQYLEATSTTHYSSQDTTQYFVTSENYAYGNPTHGLPTRVRTIGPAGLPRTKYLRYPGDYALPTAVPANPTVRGVWNLQKSHYYTPVIEESEWVRSAANPADSLLTKSVVHTYRPQRGPYGSVEDRIYRFNPVVPVAQYLRPDVTAASNWQMDGRYEEVQALDRYDPYDNLVEWHRPGLTVSYLMGHFGTVPIAEAKQAPYTQIAFTSFEADAAGRFRYDPREVAGHRVPNGRAGRWAYRLDGGWGVSRDSLAAGDYDLLFWAQSAQRPRVQTSGVIRAEQIVGTAPDNWNQFRLRLRFATTGSVNLDATAASPVLIDELRLHPVGAQMTTYTYQPLVGLTSQTDPTGRTTSYEYDSLGRLQRVRDEQGRVLREQHYHYARP